MFGGFRLLDELGRGAMGIVYRAREPGLGRDVALKVIVGRPSAKALARFEREGRVTAALEHPGIVEVHSAGVVRGVPYLAYEMVEDARTLTEAFAEAPLPLRVRLVRDVARAVGYAHSQGVVHRDLKPENVLVDREGRVRVADFGLALAQGEERLTKTGTLLGTPTHMAPEQVRGLREQTGVRSDVWGLGVLLYRALTGTEPFVAETLAGLARAICAAAPLRPRALDPTVHCAFEAVCLKALSADPGARFSDGDAVADALDQALEIASRGRRPLAARLAAGAALGVAAIVGLGGWATYAGLWGGAGGDLGSDSRGAGGDLGSDSTASSEFMESPGGDLEPDSTASSDVVGAGRSHETSEAAGAAYTQALGRAVAGEGWAMIRVGDTLAEEAEVESDWIAACRWYRKATEAGEPEGAVKLAELLLEKRESEVDAQVALWLEGASKKGDAAATRLLGRLYLAGAGVPRDPRRGASCLQGAARAGDVEAMRRLADLYLRGVGVEQSQSDAVLWTTRAAEGLDVPSMLALADRLLSGDAVKQDPGAGLRWYERAVATRDPAACFAYAQLLDVGAYVPKDDVAAARWLRRAAEAGHVPSMRALGIALQRGDGVSKDHGKARDWLRRAYEAGDVDAAAPLGWLYSADGPGLKKDFAKGLAVLARGVEAGSVEARVALARAYSEGKLGLDRAPERALVELRACAEQGSSPAMAALGAHYEGGGEDGEPIDVREAVEWYIRCAEAGESAERWVLHRLGRIYEQGKGELEPDIPRATAYYLQGAKAGLPEAMARVGELYLDGAGVGRDYALAQTWLRRAAESGSTRAMCDLADAHLEGLGVELSVERALEWLERAGDAGDAWALRRLGVIFDSGVRVVEDRARAARFFERAAALGNMQAALDLGLMLVHGRGVKRDLKKARSLFLRAGDAGVLEAYASLGDLCRSSGDGEVDLHEAAGWYRKAAASEDPFAMEGLGTVLLALGRASEGLGWLRRAAEEEPSVWVNLGLALRSGQQTARDDVEALRCFRLAADAGVPTGMVEVGRAYEHGWGVERDASEAAEWSRKAELALSQEVFGDPGDPGPLALRGALFLRRGDLDAALLDLNTALRVGPPDHAWTLEQRAHVLLLQGDAKGAIRDATRSLAGDSTSGSTWLVRAQARLLDRDSKGALEDCDAAIERGRHLDLAYGLRGYLRALKGDAKLAEEDGQRGVAEGREWLGRAHAYRGFVRSQAGRIEAARVDCERATRLAPTDADVWVLDGRVRERAGDSKGAVKSYRRAVELSPAEHPRRLTCRERLSGLALKRAHRARQSSTPSLR